MKTYPVMLVLEGCQTVVVGSGPVALRKVRSLLDAGAEVRIVTRDLADDADLGGTEVVRGDYEARHLTGAKLVFACTDSPALNAQIAADARRIGAIVNCADQPDDCDFFVPAAICEGEVVVAIGTGGASPALAAQLKQRLAEALPERIGQFAAALLRLREELKTRVDDVHRRSDILKKLAEPESYQVFLRGGQKALTGILEQLIS